MVLGFQLFFLLLSKAHYCFLSVYTFMLRDINSVDMLESMIRKWQIMDATYYTWVAAFVNINVNISNFLFSHPTANISKFTIL